MYRVKKIVPIIFGILILTSTSGFQFGPMTVQTAEAVPSKKIVGYFPYWESGDVDSIDYTKLTNIIYFHIWPNSDGSLNTSAINLNDLNTIRDRAHAVGVTISIAVGGWGVSDEFPAMAQDSIARANFVSNVSNFILDNNLDGIDIDWETPIDQIKIDNQDILLSDLADALHPLGKIVTVAANGDIVELKSSATNSIDWVNIMAYDMNWSNAEHSTFSDSVSALQRYETLGISKEKLTLGIPFYGRTDGWTSEIKYEQIVSACNPLPSENTCNGYFFNGIDLVKQKTQYVLDNGYDGIMIWNLGQDTYDETSLLNAINEILDGSPLPDLPPMATNDSYVVEAQSSLNVVSPGVLSNDNDPNGDPITLVLSTDVSSGVLTHNSDGSFSYSPNFDFEGVDSFTYYANDEVNNSNLATVTITVNPTIKVHLENLEITNSGNKRWTGTATITIFGENNIAVPGVTALGTWSGGSNGIASCVTDSSGHCQVSITTKGNTLTFTINDVSGTNVTYDSSSNKVNNSISINKDGTIPGQNNPPISDAGGPYTGAVDTAISFDGSNSVDPDGGSLTYLWIFGDGNSESGINPSHVYASDGTYNISLTVTDNEGSLDSNSSTVTVSSQGNINLTINQIYPNSMIKGETITTTISGTGFDQNVVVKFGGAKFKPSVLSTTFIDEQTIEIEITRSTAGPKQDYVYDVLVTNPNGDSFTLSNSFTVTNQ